MRISDWSSDVCSSDLGRAGRGRLPAAAGRVAHGGGPGRHWTVHRLLRGAAVRADPVALAEVGDVADLRRAQHPELGLHRAGVAVGAGRAALARLDNPAGVPGAGGGERAGRSEEHTSELQSLMRIPYAVFCLKKNTIKPTIQSLNHNATDEDCHLNSWI